MWWTVYVEGEGTYCLLCRIHNKKAKYNRTSTYNQLPSVSIKHSSLVGHAHSEGHEAAVKAEMERRVSKLASQHSVSKEVVDRVTYNAFLSAYWLAKEEVANCKLLSLMQLEDEAGLEQMQLWKNTSQRSQRGMRLLLGQLIKANIISNVKDAKYFSILVDEVTDCAVIEQLLIYIGWVDVEANSHFDFPEVKDVLEHSDSANANAITDIILTELRACGLSVELLCGFGSDGASVLSGHKNGVAGPITKESN